MKKKNKTMLFVRIVLDVVLTLAIIFGVAVSIMTFSASDNDGVPSIFGITPVAVLTDSMEGGEGGFNQGDLIFVKQVEDASQANFVVGDVITFWDYNIVPDTRVLNSHRIVEIQGSGTGTRFVTRGDNPEIALDETEITHYSLVVGEYSNVRIPFLGSLIRFIQSTLGFFICIVLPILVLFVFEGVNLVKVMIENKQQSAK